MSQPRVIFVFGSNLAGKHVGGAAADAQRFWGAADGIFNGMAGESYAIPTVDSGGHALPLDVIRRFVDEFLAYALKCQDERTWRGNMTFYVTPIGCGIAGYTAEQIAPLFRGAPSNVQLPAGWREIPS